MDQEKVIEDLELVYNISDNHLVKEIVGQAIEFIKKGYYARVD